MASVEVEVEVVSSNSITTEVESDDPETVIVVGTTPASAKVNLRQTIKCQFILHFKHAARYGSFGFGGFFTTLVCLTCIPPPFDLKEACYSGK